MEWTLKPGDQILRTALHEQFGGGSRGGIAPSARTPNVLIFSDAASGHPHGYYDGWVANREVYEYTGEGQHGDQMMAGGNAAILKHGEQNRRLRLFKGTGGQVTYVGEFDVARDHPWYLTDAPETSNGPIRQVIVFRLTPIGQVARFPSDERVPLTSGASARTVPLEVTNLEGAFFSPAREETESERREAALVTEYSVFLAGKGISVARRRYEPGGEAKPMFSDVYDEKRNNLVEAKGSCARECIRMAIGQLADYGRFEVSNPASAVLLPERPRQDLEELLRSVGVFAVWKESKGQFRDNANGRFA